LLLRKPQKERYSPLFLWAETWIPAGRLQCY